MRESAASEKASTSEIARIQKVAVRPGNFARKVGPNFSGKYEGMPEMSLPMPAKPQIMRKSRLMARSAPRMEARANFGSSSMRACNEAPEILEAASGL